MSDWTPSSFSSAQPATPLLLPGQAMPKATWWEARSPGDGVEIPFDKAEVQDDGWLTFDAFNDGQTVLQFLLLLTPEATGMIESVGRDASANADLSEPPPPGFTLTFALYPQVQARCRLPLDALRLNQWAYPREGGFLKPMAGGRPIRVDEVRHARVVVWSMGDKPQRFGLTPLCLVDEEPPRLQDPACPPGVVLDELGQSALRDWTGKSRGLGNVIDWLRRSADEAHLTTDKRFGDGRSRWGGFRVDGEAPEEASGFFRVRHDGQRWYFIDPDGDRFWSAGMNCVRVDGFAKVEGLERQCAWLPDADGEFEDCWGHDGGFPSFSWQAANLRRAFGDGWRDRWAATALHTLATLGFNTVANWSHWKAHEMPGSPTCGR